MTSEQYGTAFDRGFPRTVRFLGMRGLSREAAEEAAQMAWATGWERLYQLRDHTRLLQWVASIALNAYRKTLRSSRRNVSLHEIAVPPPINHAAIDLECILSRCGRKQREILDTYHLKGVDIVQMAHHYSCSKTAIRIRLSRARRDAAEAASIKRPQAARA